MRYFLDTNILVFLYIGNNDGLSHDTRSLIHDFGNGLMTSTVCVHELIHLIQTERIGRKNAARARTEGVISWLHEASISVVPVTEQDLSTYASLPLYPGHNDPNDRLIIAQAISERIALISSDRKFAQYERDGLDFVFNDR